MITGIALATSIQGLQGLPGNGIMWNKGGNNRNLPCLQDPSGPNRAHSRILRLIQVLPAFKFYSHMALLAHSLLLTLNGRFALQVFCPAREFSA